MRQSLVACSVQVALGAAFKYDDATTFKAKLTSDKQIGVAVKHKLRDWVTLGLSASVNTNQLAGDGHSFGLNLELTH